MRTRKTGRTALVALAVGLASAAGLAQSGLDAPKPNLGQPVSDADIAAWDIHVLPDGTGLPPGSGTPEQGAKIYATKCALCHGPEGKGGTNAALVGGQPLYALTAYILSLNKIIGPTDVMNAQTLPKVRMPNRDGFIPRFPERMPN
ncbi:MAG: cytochrome c [Acidimicrobiia bacterium]|nr:cytochrome c [Acidimicrobiia bacterium]